MANRLLSLTFVSLLLVLSSLSFVSAGSNSALEQLCAMQPNNPDCCGLEGFKDTSYCKEVTSKTDSQRPELTEEDVELGLTYEQMLAVMNCKLVGEFRECSPQGFRPFKASKNLEISVAPVENKGVLESLLANAGRRISLLNRQRYVVRTPTAVAGVRGWANTQELLDALANGEAKIVVRPKNGEGTVSLLNDPEEISLSEGRTFEPIKEKRETGLLARLFGLQSGLFGFS